MGDMTRPTQGSPDSRPPPWPMAVTHSLEFSRTGLVCFLGQEEQGQQSWVGAWWVGELF